MGNWIPAEWCLKEQRNKDKVISFKGSEQKLTIIVQMIYPLGVRAAWIFSSQVDSHADFV